MIVAVLALTACGTAPTDAADPATCRDYLDLEAEERVAYNQDLPYSDAIQVFDETGARSLVAALMLMQTCEADPESTMKDALQALADAASAEPPTCDVYLGIAPEAKLEWAGELAKSASRLFTAPVLQSAELFALVLDRACALVPSGATLVAAQEAALELPFEQYKAIISYDGSYTAMPIASPLRTGASGSATITTVDGYTFSLGYELRIVSTLARDITDAPPGYTDFVAEIPLTITVTNTTAGRNAPWNGTAYVFVRGSVGRSAFCDDAVGALRSADGFDCTLSITGDAAPAAVDIAPGASVSGAWGGRRVIIDDVPESLQLDAQFPSLATHLAIHGSKIASVVDSATGCAFSSSGDGNWSAQLTTTGILC